MNWLTQNVQRALAQLNENKMEKLNFTFTLDQINLILQAIQELPAKVANPLSKEIHEQAQAQFPEEKAPEVVKAEVVED
jgi:hypothetical protein